MRRLEARTTAERNATGMIEIEKTVTDSELIAAVLRGEEVCFEPIIQKYQPRIFAMARRYARREDEVEDIVQEVFIKAFQNLSHYRGDAPFEHWLMRIATRTCYDFLRSHRRHRERTFSELDKEGAGWLQDWIAEEGPDEEHADAARALVGKILDQLSPGARLVITLLEIEERSVKEIAALTGWSVPLVKVRAFRARAEMRKCLRRIVPEKYL
jgi:RNA polymerase sigma-70 factor (ECF subfamily)